MIGLAGGVFYGHHTFILHGDPFEQFHVHGRTIAENTSESSSTPISTPSSRAPPSRWFQRQVQCVNISHMRIDPRLLMCETFTYNH